MLVVSQVTVSTYILLLPDDTPHANVNGVLSTGDVAVNRTGGSYDMIVCMWAIYGKHMCIHRQAGK